MVTILSVVLITNGLDIALAAVIYPVFVSELYGSAIGLGLVFGLSGGGAVLGALWYGAKGEFYPRRKVFLAAWLLISLARLILIFLPPLWLLLLTSLIVGLSSGPLNPILQTISYKRIPAEMRARVLGLITSGALLAMPLGVLLAGYALEWVGLRATIAIVVGCYLLTAFVLFFNRRLYTMDVAVEVAS